MSKGNMARRDKYSTWDPGTIVGEMCWNFRDFSKNTPRIVSPLLSREHKVKVDYSKNVNLYQFVESVSKK